MKFIDLYCESVQEDAINKVVKTTGLDKSIVGAMAAIDPTKKKSYLSWIANQTKKGNIVWDEDEETTKELIQEIEAKKNRISGFDINRYSAHEIRAMLNSALEDVSDDEIKNALEAGASEVAHDSHYRIIRLDAPKETMAMCQNLAWCTKTETQAANYTKQGPLFAVVKDGRRIALIHPASGSAKDVNDRPITRSLGSPLAKFIDAMGIKDLRGELKNLKPVIDPEKAKAMTANEVLSLDNPEIATLWLSLHRGKQTNQHVVKLALRTTFYDFANTVIDLIKSHVIKPADITMADMDAIPDYTKSWVIDKLVETTKRRFPNLEGELEGLDLVQYIANVVRGNIDNIEDLKKKHINENTKPGMLVAYIRVSKREEPWMKDVVLKNPAAAVAYSDSDLHGKRFPEAEEIISKDGILAWEYIRIHKQPIPAFEKAIVGQMPIKRISADRGWNAELVTQYVLNGKRTPWPELEDVIIDYHQDKKSFEQYVKLVAKHDGKPGLLRLRKKADEILAGIKSSYRAKNAKRLYSEIDREIYLSSDTGIARKAGSGAGHAVYVARDAEGAKHFAGTAAAELAKKLDVSRENPVALFIGAKKKLLGASSATKIIDSTGSDANKANAKEMSVLAFRHLKEPLVSVFDEHIRKIKEEPESISAEDVVKSNNPQIAYKWASSATGKIPERILSLAALRLDRTNSIHLIKHALENGMEPDEIPLRLAKAATDGGGWPGALSLARDTRRRWKTLETGTTPAAQIIFEYLGHLRHNGEWSDDVGDLVDKMMRERNSRIPFIALEELGIDEPDWFREWSMSNAYGAVMYAKHILHKPLDKAQEDKIVSSGVFNLILKYAQEFKRDWPEAEKKLLETQDGENLAEYAVNVMQHSWHEAEKKMMEGYWGIGVRKYIEMIDKQEGEAAYKRLKAIVDTFHDNTKLNTLNYTMRAK